VCSVKCRLDSFALRYLSLFVVEEIKNELLDEMEVIIETKNKKDKKGNRTTTRTTVDRELALVNDVDLGLVSVRLFLVLFVGARV